MAQTVIGIFDDASDAQQAVDALVNKGFSRNDIDMSAGRYSETTGTDDTYANQDVNTAGTYTDTTTRNDKKESGGIGGFFSSLFGSDDDDDTHRYSTVANQGSVVTVHVKTEDEADRAADILDDNGAVDVNERAATYGYVNTTGATTTGATTTGTTTTDTTRPFDNNADQTIKVIEENLEVGKREIERGGVRVKSRIIERPVEESVRLREERVIVRRNPVNRPASATDLNAFQEGEITLTEHAEVPVVNKTANVVEEISVGKEVSEREETIRDTVRKTDVDVEQITPSSQNLSTGQQNLSTDEDMTYSTK